MLSVIYSKEVFVKMMEPERLERQEWTSEEKTNLLGSYLQLNELIEFDETRAVVDFIKRRKIAPDNFKTVVHKYILTMSPVATAAKYGKLQTMNELISLGFSTHDKSVGIFRDWRRPIHFAAIENQMLTVKNLVEDHNIDIDSQCSEGLTPLVLSVLRSKDIETCKYLVEAGASINNPYGESNNTPLHFAAQHARTDICTDICKYLISKGADVNTQNDFGRTPFTVALDRPGCVQLISSMLDAGADVNFDLKGDKPLHIALKSMVQDYRNLDLIKLLCTRGADVNAKNSRHETPLLLATMEGFSEIARYLIVDMNALVDTVNIDNLSPFTFAFDNRDADTVELIVACGYNPCLEGCMCEWYDDMINDSNDWKKLGTRLRQIGSNALSLKRLCISKVRCMLNSGPGFKSDMDSLKLPYTLRDEIALK